MDRTGFVFWVNRKSLRQSRVVSGGEFEADKRGTGNQSEAENNQSRQRELKHVAGLGGFRIFATAHNRKAGNATARVKGNEGNII